MKPARRPGESWYRWCRRNRLCVWCASSKIVTRAHCEEHRKVFNDLMRPKIKLRTDAVRKQRYADHLCLICGAEAVTRRHCEYHRELHNAAVVRSMMKRYWAKKAG